MRTICERVAGPNGREDYHAAAARLCGPAVISEKYRPRRRDANTHLLQNEPLFKLCRRY